MKNLMIVAIFVALLIGMGCAKKEVPMDHIKLLAAVKTAVAIKSEKQLNNCRTEIDNDVQNNKMTGDMASQLKKVLDLAAEEQWAKAEEAIIKIQKKYTVNTSGESDQSNHTGHNH
ncbi:MAG: hypothetical protein Q4G68_12470 [Planctomycetia bacterium]|nr:hypothetical protein [Planctomycetia bacterium]